MRPLLVNSEDLRGGAARAAYRLHLALRGIGIDARMLVQIKHGDAPSVIGPQSPFQRLSASLRAAADLLPVIAYRGRKQRTFYPGWLPDGLAGGIARLEPDLVHLHWIAGGALNVRSLQKLKRPIVWTLHDMWAFTGGCHFDEGCGRFNSGCGACPVLASNWQVDLSSFGWRRKQRAYRPLQMHVVAPSRWLGDLARNSRLLAPFPVSVIPNAIDTQVFRPIDKRLAREILRLPPEGNIVLYGALRSTVDELKGFPYLVEALQRFSQRQQQRNCRVVVFGATRPDKAPECGIETIYMGTLADDVTLALLYSAADVFVAPSKQENLSNTVMESLSCGTPAVAFSIGGMPDMIEHQRNGYLARPYECGELADGIAWVLDDPARWTSLSRRARDKAVEQFDSHIIARQHLVLYERIQASTRAAANEA
jgi:glycosyltransferase involved in cell wall biosynthesis